MSVRYKSHKEQTNKKRKCQDCRILFLYKHFLMRGVDKQVCSSTILQIMSQVCKKQIQDLYIEQCYRPIVLYCVSIQYSPSFSDMFCFLPLCKKICLHSTKQMFTVFAVLLLICVRESSAYVNSYVVMTSTLLTVVSMYFIIALATASNCSIGNVVALLCITSRWRRAV